MLSSMAEKSLSIDGIEGLASLLRSLGIWVTRRASTISMTDDGKGMKIIRKPGWIGVSSEDLTPEIQEMIDVYIEEQG